MYDLKKANPVYRNEDNELLGYVLQDNTEWLPLTIFGYALDHCPTQADALRVVSNKGLESLLDTWQYFDNRLNDWFNCKIVEAKEVEVTVRITDYGHPKAHQTIVIHELSDINFRK